MQTVPGEMNRRVFAVKILLLLLFIYFNIFFKELRETVNTKQPTSHFAAHHFL